MPLEPEEVNEIAAGWIRLHRLERRWPDQEQFFWAWERLDRLVREKPEDAWTVIEAIHQLDQSDRILSNLAAGPLEDLLAKHGPAFIDRIEVRARQEPEFRKLLGGVWQNAMLENVWNRVKAAAGPPC